MRKGVCIKSLYVLLVTGAMTLSAPVRPDALEASPLYFKGHSVSYSGSKKSISIPDRKNGISVWLTTPDQHSLLALQASLQFTKEQGNPVTIRVDDTTTYQIMEGFGAALTESSAWLIATKLTPARRATLLKKLFDPVSGAGLSSLRIVMGASDFALRSYTYDDLPSGETDPDLAHFSVEHDRATIIPTLLEALKIDPKLFIIATPWSPPAWMKTSNALNSGKLKPNFYGAYADYFVKFLDAYRDAGIPIQAITIQNEPHNEPTGYPCMRMDSREQASFIKEALGPKFKAAKVGTRIIVWDHNWNEANYPVEVLNDDLARPYVSGAAFHCYGGTVEDQDKMHFAYPDKGIYFTECSGGDWATDFGANLSWNMHNLMIGSTRHWAKTVLYWNLALDEQHGPQNGGCNNCRGVVTVPQVNGDIAYNVEYYALAHVSKFVRKGAVRIETNSYHGSIENVAFKNPDGSLVLVALNAGSDTKVFSLLWREQTCSYSLPAGAVATFKWGGK